ncbi:MAG: hypothetical protein AMJ46_10035 [Latescibacteria bacterium DG_63]|nr:MAG: hypothetical protein AMJ46_10035 [Latescibacteria bacterium DG_63]
MKCPRCKREIESGQKNCSYCGAEIKRPLIRRLLEGLTAPETDEQQIARAVATGKKPRIASTEDVGLYLKHAIGDEKFALILAEAMGKIGKDGCLRIKRGGEGDPYSVEYTYSELPQHMSGREIAKRVQELRRALAQAKSPIEEERLQEELVRLSETTATIWVNSSSEEDLDKADLLLEKAIEALRRFSG